MDLANVDRKTLKQVIKEVLIEDTDLFKELVKETLAENQILSSDLPMDRQEQLKKLVSEDFNKYDDVFKALA